LCLPCTFVSNTNETPVRAAPRRRCALCHGATSSARAARREETEQVLGQAAIVGKGARKEEGHRGCQSGQQKRARPARTYVRHPPRLARACKGLYRLATSKEPLSIHQYTMPFILTVLHAVSRSLSLLCTAPSTPLWTHPHPHTNAHPRLCFAHLRLGTTHFVVGVVCKVHVCAEYQTRCKTTKRMGVCITRHQEGGRGDWAGCGL
jgi:hypothetical protein